MHHIKDLHFILYSSWARVLASEKSTQKPPEYIFVFMASSEFSAVELGEIKMYVVMNASILRCSS